MKNSIQNYSSYNSSFNNTSLLAKILLMLCFLYPAYISYTSYNIIFFSSFIALEIILLFFWSKLTASFSVEESSIKRQEKNKIYKNYKASQIHNYLRVSFFINRVQEDSIETLLAFKDYKLWHNNLTNVEVDRKGIHLATTSNENFTLDRLDLVNLSDRILFIGKYLNINLT